MQRLLAEHGPFDFILGSDILYSRAAYGDLLSTITFFSQPHTRTWLACPRRDEGLGEGYGGKYFASGKATEPRRALLLVAAALHTPRRVAMASVATRPLRRVDSRCLLTLGARISRLQSRRVLLWMRTWPRAVRWSIRRLHWTQDTRYVLASVLACRLLGRCVGGSRHVVCLMCIVLCQRLGRVGPQQDIPPGVTIAVVGHPCMFCLPTLMQSRLIGTQIRVIDLWIKFYPSVHSLSSRALLFWQQRAC